MTDILLGLRSKTGFASNPSLEKAIYFDRIVQLF
jgi:hypothetical protein